MHQFDDVKLGFDNNGDGDILDAGDDVLVDDNFNSNQISLSYDDNGNLTADGVYNYEYDAWNRLRKAQLVVGSDTTTIGEYEYFGDTRRSKKIVQNHGPEVVENDGGNTTVVFYYCGVGGTGVSPVRWSICETRNGSNQTTFQHLWGTQYTDELIWIEKNGDPTESNDTNPDDQAGESTADERYFVHQDRNWNVVALTEYDPQGTNNGRIAERYSYTPYGSFVVLKGDSGCGELDALSLTSIIGNPFAHQGLPFDAEKVGYQNRRREYRSEAFVQRDPTGHPGGVSLYEYEGSSPICRTDPAGLTAMLPLLLPPIPPVPGPAPVIPGCPIGFCVDDPSVMHPNRRCCREIIEPEIFCDPWPRTFCPRSLHFCYWKTDGCHIVPPPPDGGPAEEVPCSQAGAIPHRAGDLVDFHQDCHGTATGALFGSCVYLNPVCVLQHWIYDAGHIDDPNREDC